MNSVILVLDRMEYRRREQEIRKTVQKYYSNVEVVYTTYENELIRTVRSWKFIGKLFQHVLYWWLSYRYAAKIGRRAKEKKIICINPIVGIFLGIFNSKKQFDLIVCGFLFEPKKNKFYYNIRKRFTYAAMKGVDKMIVYSRKEVTYYQNLFPKYSGFLFVPFGMDYFENLPYAGKLPKEFLFSGGGSNRDYTTLLKGYELLEKNCDIPLVIATNPLLIAQKHSEKISVLSDVVVENFGTVLSKAKCLILSLKNGHISTGHMVMLQALCENIPIIVNKIDAVQDYVSDKQVLFYKSGNAADMKEKIEMFLNGKWIATDNTGLYQTQYTFIAMLERIIRVTQ